MKNRLLVGVSNLVWRVKAEGLRRTLGYSRRKLRALNEGHVQYVDRPRRETGHAVEECLNLQPGELVEVLSEEEIHATLDERGRLRGLALMSGMNRHCGKQYRVFKRLEIMMSESTREYRTVRNTVLLDGVMCDGRSFNGCDRSCFYFWREAWLKRVEAGRGDALPLAGSRPRLLAHSAPPGAVTGRRP